MNTLSAIDDVDKIIIDIISHNFNDDELWGKFNTAAALIHRIQFNKVDHYRNACKTHGIGDEYVGIDKLPLIKTECFKGAHIPSLLSEVSDGMTVKTSGTTTGNSTSIFRDAGFFHLATRALKRIGHDVWFNGIDTPIDIAFLDLPNRNNDKRFRHDFSMLNFIKDEFGSESSLYVDTKEDDGVAGLIEKIYANRCTKRPIVIIGPSYRFSRIIEKMIARSMNGHLPPGSLIMDSGGLKGVGAHNDTESYERDLFKIFGIDHSQRINTYAMVEIGSQLPINKATGAIHSLPWCIVRVVSDSQDIHRFANHGEEGDIVVYDLMNRANIFPLRTGDRGIAVNEGVVFKRRRLVDSKNV